MSSYIAPYTKMRAPGPLVPTPTSHTSLELKPVAVNYVTSFTRPKSSESFGPSLLDPTPHECVMGLAFDPPLRLYFDSSYPTSLAPIFTLLPFTRS